jgi:CelD/BcsL family acetyltransferase involved in cellulose biosynthesis
MPGDRVEIGDLAGAWAHEGAWRDLGARALEPNVFAEPEFVLSALRHIALAGRRQLLFVWRDLPNRHLIGAAVVEFPLRLFGLAVARLWQGEQAGLAALVVDREAAEAALEAILDWIARERPGIIGLFAPTLVVDGPTESILRSIAARRQTLFRRFGPRNRAALGIAQGKMQGFEQSLPKKRLKEWSRQMRRLRERGDVEFRIVRDSSATEPFFALEAKGWKGGQGTALGADPGLAAFTRSMLDSLAQQGKLAVHLLELDGEALAAGLLLRSGERAFYWKTAYDESYSEYSPGVQLTLEMSRIQQRDTTIALTDSCAIEGHPMIERLWAARLEFADTVVATRPEAASRLGLWLRFEMARRRLKEAAKQVINPLRGRKRS